MKKIITTTLLIMIMKVAYSNHAMSDFHLTINTPGLYTVFMDHRTVNNVSGGFMISEVTPGRHYISVHRSASRHAYSAPLYSGYVDIPASSVVKAVAGNRRLQIVEVFPKYHTPVYVPYAGMSSHEFNELRSLIRNKSFDSSKLSIAKQAVSSHRISSRQVSELLSLFAFDSTRLEFARFAYGYVADPARYYLTYDSFTFESSVEELIEYMGHS